MEIGLFSNGERQNQIARITYDEDLAEVILADELGVQEAWISEHETFVSFHAPDIGGFGVLLLLAGKDWGDPEQRHRSMRLFMSEVAPRLAHLNPDGAAA